MGTVFSRDEVRAQGKMGRSPLYVATAILVAAVLLSATLVIAPSLTRTVTQVSTVTSTTTVTSVSTQSVTKTIPADCVGTPVSGYWFGTLHVGTSSPATICVQLYEFNATSPIVLNPTSLINITGVNPVSGQPVNGLSNFTIAATSDSLDLGGPTNASEGVVLAFAITAKPGTSGTYWVEVQHGWYLGAQAMRAGPNGVIVAGTGQPDYVPSQVTRLPLGLGCSSPAFSIQAVAYGICADILYYRITDVTNSTG